LSGLLCTFRLPPALFLGLAFKPKLVRDVPQQIRKPSYLIKLPLIGIFDNMAEKNRLGGFGNQLDWLHKEF
jgi:hypothetical protein